MSECFQKLEKKKILSILGSNRELYKMCSAKIYTSNLAGDSWLYSDLEGFLCFVLDYNIKTRYFVLFDPLTYERLFQFELYNNFEKEFQKLAEDFFCFEAGNGFIGIKFDDQKEASEFNGIVRKFNDFLVDNLFDANLQSNNVYNFKKQEVIVSYLEIIKQKFSASENKFNEDYIEDGMEIRKPKYLELLNNIAFDREKKEFKIGKLPQEFKDIFKNIGIKKSDIKDPKRALNILKNVIDVLDSNVDNKENEVKFGNAFKKTIAKIKNRKKVSMEGTTPTSVNIGGLNANKIYEEDNNMIEVDKENKSVVENAGDNHQENQNKKNIPSIPKVPAIPSIPAVPKVPAVPKIPNVPVIYPINI